MEPTKGLEENGPSPFAPPWFGKQMKTGPTATVKFLRSLFFRQHTILVTFGVGSLKFLMSIAKNCWANARTLQLKVVFVRKS